MLSEPDTVGATTKPQPVTRMDLSAHSGRARSGARLGRLDVLAIVGLLVAAVITRRNVLPHDGLSGDDAWQALGAAKGSLGNFITVGFSAPGFTGALMVWNRLVAGPERMADLAFVAGVLTPPVAYVLLRRFGYARSICLLVGTAIAAESLNIAYSGRVKSYVVDVLIVFGFAAVLPRIVRVRFGWRAVALWVVGSFAVGFFSPFALVAAVVAGIILLLRPAGDRSMRVAAVVGQTVLALGLSLAVSRTYSARSLELWWKRNYDGIVGFDLQPLRFVSTVVTHLRRVAGVFSGGPAWWAALILITAFVALAADARVRRRSARGLRAQYLLLLAFVALAASVASVLPLGPTAAGMRLSLWLVPIFATGIASALQWARTAVSGRHVGRIGFDAAAVVVSALLVVGASDGGPSYPLSGSRSATRFVERELSTNDAVFIENDGAVYPYAVASDLHVVLVPHHAKVAFKPEIRDRRFHYITFTGRLGNKFLLSTNSDSGHETNIARAIGGADRVFLYVETESGVVRRGGLAFNTVLRGLGFSTARDNRFDNAHVTIWQRTAP
ncbi:MAG: hypothetical protein QOG65_3119 [Actinomycetota bacterium]|jgi:hypothetical protein|nr:hypothetical protein [Actinomycetota bacterium]